MRRNGHTARSIAVAGTRRRHVEVWGGGARLCAATGVGVVGMAVAGRAAGAGGRRSLPAAGSPAWGPASPWFSRSGCGPRDLANDG